MLLVHGTRAYLTPSHIPRIVERPVPRDAASRLEANRSLRDSGPDRRRYRKRRRQRNWIGDDVGAQHLANLGVPLLGRIEGGNQLPDPPVFRLEPGDFILQARNPGRCAENGKIERCGEEESGTDHCTDERKRTKSPERNPDRA
jgi:hypothetical protein